MSDEAPSDSVREFQAIQTIYEALEPLTPEGRGRVVAYMVSLLGIADLASDPPGLPRTAERDTEQPAEKDDSSFVERAFTTFAELHDAAAPATNADNALVAAYWLQECADNETFASQTVNVELKQLGEGLKNITRAFDLLKASDPALVLQVRKSGRTRQGRKTYKLTRAGVMRIQEMIDG